MDIDCIDIVFGGSRVSHAVKVDLSTPPQDILSKLGFDKLSRGVIPVSGGAYDYPEDVIEPTDRLVRAILELAFEHDIMMIDGGTETGVMKLLGQNYRLLVERGNSIQAPPLIGFSPYPKIEYPGIDGNGQLGVDIAKLDENHPYFVLINDAEDWGGEVKSMFKVVDYLTALNIPSVALIANGGLTTLQETEHNVEQRRPIVVLEGTKRAAKLIVCAVEGVSESRLEDMLLEPGANLIKKNNPQYELKLQEVLDQLRRISQYPNITRFRLEQPVDEIKKLFEKLLLLE